MWSQATFWWQKRSIWLLETLPDWQRRIQFLLPLLKLVCDATVSLIRWLQLRHTGVACYITIPSDSGWCNVLSAHITHPPATPLMYPQTHAGYQSKPHDLVLLICSHFYICDIKAVSSMTMMTTLRQSKIYLCGCGVQPITALHGILNRVSLVSALRSTIMSGEMPR